MAVFRNKKRLIPIQTILGGLVLVSFMASTVFTPLTWAENDAEEAPRKIDSIDLRGEAQESVLSVDLPLLVHLIESKNLDVAISETQVEQAKGVLNASYAGLFPSIRSNSYVEKLNGGDIFIGPTPFPVDRTTYQPKLSADYQIQLGGKVLYQIFSSKFQLQRYRSTQKKVLQNALLEAISQYYTLLRDTAAVDVARQSLKEADAQLQFNQARFKAGFGTRLDVTQSETLQAQRKSELLQAENTKALSSILLGSLIVLPIDVSLEPVATELKPMNFVDVTLPLPKLYETSLYNRPDLKELAFQIKEAKAHYGITRADLFPTVSLSAYHRGVGPRPDKLRQTDETFASINIDLLKNLAWGTLGQMQSDRARIKETLLNYQKQLTEIQKTVSQAYLDSRLYRSQIDVTEQKMKSAFESYRIAGARLRTGVGVNLDVVQAQKDFTDARLEHLTAIMNYNIAQTKLLFETGQLTPQYLLLNLKNSLASQP